MNGHALLAMIERETGNVYRKKTTHEYAGACPWCGGVDRFQVWVKDDRPHYWCRSCDRKGDAIQFLRDFRNLPFAQAKELAEADDLYVDDGSTVKRAPCPARLDAPAPTWETMAAAFVKECYGNLYGESGEKAMAWLNGRRLAAETLYKAGIGYNPVERYVERESWGLPPAMSKKSGKPKGLWLPRGIVIPWFLDDQVWSVRIRRPVGDPKYYLLPGGQTRGLYRAGTVRAGAPVVLVEGEFDALMIVQGTGWKVAAVATGSTGGARNHRWLMRLATASVVLVAYDADEGGDKAAEYWLDSLPNARRWRPYWGDVSDMAKDGVDLAAWVSEGVA
ncbi:MAG: toprim domain-containing protein [Caldilineaceae bacterium]|nr:toprim domain-containing protein [Caldilineaceae bacterium]MCB9119369.1 toprim domain-containing protein [Caldilineaceae bacterium]HRX02711.1 CHC2 zinc finger domain-containing protein [Anaerolineae bacterium]